MKTAIILHGTQGSPEGNWFRWLEDKLKVKGLQVWLPTLPDAELPSSREWLDFIHENAPFKIDEDTLIVGHSSGAILALLIAQESKEKVGAGVIVSVFHDNSLGWDANSQFFDEHFDFEKITRNFSRRILCIHSDTDPYVPLEQAKYVADNIGAEFIIIPEQGHFNLEQSPEYTEFPYLYALLEEEIL